MKKFIQPPMLAALAAALVLVVGFTAPADKPALLAAGGSLLTPAPSASYTPAASPTPTATPAPDATVQTQAAAATLAPQPAATMAASASPAPTATPAPDTAISQGQTVKALHINVYDRENLRALGNAAQKELAPMGINTLIVEIDDRFQFQSDPKISAGDITADDARAFAKQVRDAGIDVIPLYNSLGHQGAGGQRNALLKVYPEFDETPDVPVSAGLPEFYTPAWCPSNDAVYDVVLPAIDELVNAFGATTFHVGMDEVFEMGKCSKCEGKSTAELFAATAQRLHGHLQARGVRMMMWGDRLLNSKDVRHTWEGSANGTDKAITMLPRDIIIADWHYEKGPYPSTGILLEAGYQRVLPAVWKDKDNALRFVRSAEAQADEYDKESAVNGAIVTVWSVPPVRLDAVFHSPDKELNAAEEGLRDTLRAVLGEYKK